MGDLVEGDYVRSPVTNDWHYVSIRRKSENVFTWKNKADVQWDLIFLEEERGGVLKFKVGDNPYTKHGYHEARLFTENTIKIEGPYKEMYTKKEATTPGDTAQDDLSE